MAGSTVCIAFLSFAVWAHHTFAVGSRLSDAQLTMRILNGGENMPADGRILTPAELNDLVAFLASRKAP